MHYREDSIKVLIVDDSRIFRSIVVEALEVAHDIQVIGSTWSGLKALEIINKQRPDVVLLDVEMPGIDGLETLAEIRAFNKRDPSLPPIQVIMLSMHTSEGSITTIKALSGGAFDFVPKPMGGNASHSLEILRHALIPKIRATREGRLAAQPKPTIPPPATHLRYKRPMAFPPPPIKVILVGCSTGGPRALTTFLPQLCQFTHLPILLVQHMPAAFTESLAQSLDKICAHKVMEAEHNSEVLPDHVYIAPGGYHLMVRHNHDMQVITHLNQHPPENGCRPAVDVLFRSAVPIYQNHILAFVLTGMGKDGCRGAAALKRAGSHVLVQDQETSVVWGMPGAIVAQGLHDGVYPIQELATEALPLLPQLTT